MKFEGTEHEDAVRETSSPKEAAKRGYDRSRPLREDWEQIPEQVREHVVDIALEHAEMSPRQLAWHITDNKGYFMCVSHLKKL